MKRLAVLLAIVAALLFAQKVDEKAEIQLNMTGSQPVLLITQDTPAVEVIKSAPAGYTPESYTRLQVRMDPWSDPVYRLNPRGEVYVGEKLLITETGALNGTPAELHAALTALAESIRAFSDGPFPKEAINRWSLNWATPLKREDTKVTPLGKENTK